MRNFHLTSVLYSASQIWGGDFAIFVAFSEYMNFNNQIIMGLLRVLNSLELSALLYLLSQKRVQGVFVLLALKFEIPKVASLFKAPPKNKEKKYKRYNAGFNRHCFWNWCIRSTKQITEMIYLWWGETNYHSEVPR